MAEERRPSRSRIEELVESGQITLIPAPPEVLAAEEFQTITFSRTVKGHQADRLKGKEGHHWVVLLDEGQKDVYGEFTVSHRGPVNGIKYQDPQDSPRQRRMSLSNELEFTILQSERNRGFFAAFFNPSE